MDYRLEQLRFELREDPSSRIFFKLGEHLRRAGELDEAIEILRTGLEHHERYIAAWVSLGRAQLDNGDAEGAHASLERAVQLDPENSVAARVMGEAAILRGDWVTAVKALKRARGLSPQDDALDERIAFVEERLAELDLLKTPAAATTNRVAPAEDSEASKGAEPAQPAASADGAQSWSDENDEPFAVTAGDTGAWDNADDVFAGGWVEDEPVSEDETIDDEGDESAPAASAEVAEGLGDFSEPPPLTDDDLAWMVDADETPEGPEPSQPVDDVAKEEAPAEAAEPAFSAPEPDVITEAELEAVVESEPLPDSWPDPEADTGPETEKDSHGVPLPTMTLARLAIDQGDIDLAERTLRGVLEREPDHPEAAELLEILVAGPPDVGATTDGTEPSDSKAEALQRWLDAVRLASERLQT